ncbi:hypothetical protein FFLO_06707 [Filobasidium floriforme]|uniref:Carrier domain-containing protein n=1 Tax=Filobasidium floriforme TaxID=5210 RepID=A0A8K0JEQ1_9TREE|nr:hypothetical protein FFLO_06707 [Filobasidium floriforme]
MGLGLGVVFVAPQCSASAVSHLLDSTKSTQLLYHPRYQDLAESAHQRSPSIPLLPLPAISSLPTTPFDPTWPPEPPHPDCTSHIFHTSGTSGTPKPIPHFHRAEVLALPRRDLGHADTLQSAFTTTPLFHGGVSDLLRAWMARSTLYLFPSSTSAITSRSIVDSVSACQTQILSPKGSRCPITSFLSVPYILTLLSPASDPEDKNGATALLAGMEIVSTGGAPLDKVVGDGLVERGVNLVSRLGSSECGFLLTSYRDFKTDKEWEWLHNNSAYASALVFEPFEGNKAEMVVTNDWRSKVKSNRPDGSYATGDIYERHATKPNVWRYAGRGDDVLVMSNGEKMSPGPIETILRSSNLIADVLVVGSNKPQIGCLLFPRTFPPPSDLVKQLANLIAQANEQSPSHAQLGDEMCLVISDPDRAAALPKSSKGTIQRGVAYDVYKDEIDAMYGESNGADGDKLDITGEELEKWLVDKVGEIMGDGKRYNQDVFDAETDLFSWGVDSVKAARLRFAMMKDLNLGGQSLPMNVVFEYSTVRRLAGLCTSLRAGEEVKSSTADDQYERMIALVEKYGEFTDMAAGKQDDEGRPSSPGGKTIILTGATGSLGSHLLAQLAKRPEDEVKHIVCLVRGDTTESAAERVRKALSARRLVASPKRYTVVVARLGQTNLGLEQAAYDQLVDSADIIIHAAWAVHFGSGLDSFENDHIRGTRHLLDLAATSSHQTKVFFCSSLASVLNGASLDDPIPERLSSSPSTSIPIGYSRSKWVTEQICGKAASTALHNRVQVLRIGQLCGDVEHGIWNESEGWPLMLRTAGTTGKLPKLKEDPSWLPVDIAASAVMEIALTNRPDVPLVAHVANPLPNTWEDILSGLIEAGVSFETVDATEWVEAVDKSEGDETTNPSRKMLSMWRGAYGDEKTGNRPAAPVSTSEAVALSPALASCKPVSSELIKKMVARWRESGFMNE